MSQANPEVLKRAAAIKLVLLDVDGVLTDGRLHMYSDGTEGRSFHTHDGHGIRMAQRVGLEFAILSGRQSAIVEARARELSIDEVHQRVFRKGERLDEILQRRRLSEQEICYIGDDLVDLPVMRRVGLAVAPANARPEVIDIAHYVTQRAGGDGAVREVVDLLLRVKGAWDRVTETYFR